MLKTQGGGTCLKVLWRHVCKTRSLLQKTFINVYYDIWCMCNAVSVIQ